jgi:hypothetical protein
MSEGGRLESRYWGAKAIQPANSAQCTWSDDSAEMYHEQSGQNLTHEGGPNFNGSQYGVTKARANPLPRAPRLDPLGGAPTENLPGEMIARRASSGRDLRTR